MATHADFGSETEATTVARVFSSQIAGKIILITGVNLGGIGGSTVEALAAHSPQMLILTGRSQAKVDEVIKKTQPLHPKVTYRFLHLDLSSQRSVRAAAQEVLSSSDIPQVDILINNAGVMDIQTRTLSEDGVEMQFATNHIGHFLFTNLILPKLIASSEKLPKGATRVVNVSSTGHQFSPVRFSDPNFTVPADRLPESEKPNYARMEELLMKTGGVYIPFAAYGQSKTANILFSLALTRRLYSEHGILSFSLHPGSIPTELIRHSDTAHLDAVRKRFMGIVMRKTLGMGAATTLVAALDPKLGPARETGEGVYLSDCQIIEPMNWARDPIATEKLWALSNDIVGETFQNWPFAKD